MKFHSRWAITALFVVASSVSSVTNAALVDRGGGLIYDTDLNVTWLADMNYAKTSGYSATGFMNWYDAMTWVSNLSYGGYNDWRLPTMSQPDPTCDTQVGSSTGYHCVSSEMTHLFKDMGGVEGISSIADPNNATNPNFLLFSNYEGYAGGPGSAYWSNVTHPTISDYAFFNSFNWGNVSYDYKNFPSFPDQGPFRAALAVRSGDVAAVPVPASVWLFGSSLLGLIGVARRKAA